MARTRTVTTDQLKSGHVVVDPVVPTIAIGVVRGVEHITDAGPELTRFVTYRGMSAGDGHYYRPSDTHEVRVPDAASA